MFTNHAKAFLSLILSASRYAGFHVMNLALVSKGDGPVELARIKELYLNHMWQYDEIPIKIRELLPNLEEKNLEWHASLYDFGLKNFEDEVYAQLLTVLKREWMNYYLITLVDAVILQMYDVRLPHIKAARDELYKVSFDSISVNVKLNSLKHMAIPPVKNPVIKLIK